MSKQIKVTVVGNSSVGKTCMIISYVTNSFPEEYVPTVFDNYVAKTVVLGNPVDLVLFDTAGDSEYDSIRPLNYNGTDVFLICFSIVSYDSAESVLKKWLDEVRSKCPNAPLFLVGTKSDLRDNAELKEQLKKENKAPISKEEGERLAACIGAHKYLECSAITQVGLQQLFEEVVKIILYPKPAPTPDKDKAKSCCIQ